MVNIIWKAINRDPRNWQLVFLSTFLLFGIWKLNWQQEILNFLIIIPSVLAFQFFFIKFLGLHTDTLKSALITGFGLTLLFKTNEPIVLIFAAFLAIAGKFLIRYKGKHIFNPANFGIIATILLTNNGWVSPGQWGSSLLLFLIIGSAGLMVLQRSNRIDTGIAFLSTLFLLDFARMIVYQGWEWDVLLHKYTSGSVLLFSFFMITDPVTTPNHRTGRIIFAALIALLSFYLQSFIQVHTAPVWALFFISPITLILDIMYKSPRFDWLRARISHTVKLAGFLLIIAFSCIPTPSAKAFCGFYVAKADAKLFNKTSQVILVRDGQRSVITMSSDFQGNVRDFAMVVPVPVILRREQIRIVDASLFRTLDDYSGPRLVEYFDENPCYPKIMEDNLSFSGMRSAANEEMMPTSKARKQETRVKIEARYTVGEYDILLLSAKESGGLRSWLIENGYKIPANADAVLDPYIKSNMKFFVVKVNLDEQEKLGFNELRPIQIEFDSPKFMLPIRLGMANANGDQDMIVYAFSKSGRVECTNYRTEKIPTDRNVPLDVESKFGKFYKALFDRVWARQKDAVFLEYAWNVTPSWGGMKCDPCVGPPPLTADLAQAGVNWSSNGSGSPVYFSRLHVRYGRAYFPQDLIFQETSNRENFQGRYILTHPAQGDLSCKAGQQYCIDLTRKRQREVQNLSALTGWRTSEYQYYINEYRSQITDPYIRENVLVPVLSLPDDPEDNLPKGLFTLALILLLSWSIFALNRKSKFDKPRPIQIEKD
jgi:Na+-translocating ferredoxin:NAD+ oxidoreductase RnfD subunit